MGDDGRGRWVRHLVLSALGVGLVVLWLLLADVENVLRDVRAIQTATVVVATGLALAAYVPRLWSLHALSRNSDVPLSVSESLRAGFGSNTLNLLLPARLGDVATITSLSRNRASPDATALVFAWRALSLLALLSLWGAVLLAGVLGWPTA